MTNTTIFPEKRTRSQITLPDEILQIPHGSPMKDARNALRNHTVTVDTFSPSDSKKQSDDTDDELLLSPGKQSPLMRMLSNPKRSASPPLQDEYTPSSGSSEGRSLKRAKRELGPSDGTEGEAENLQSPHSFYKTLAPGHTRNHSDSTVHATTRRSARKRSATNKKPISTLSASPPPSTFSPIVGSSKQERAQSVPLFPTGHDIPHIDFRNPPPSPKRSPSPSRSPSKNKEAKLRPIFKTFPAIKELPTVHDEIPMPMNLDDDTRSVHKEIELEKNPAAESSVESQVTLTVIEPSSHSPLTPPSTSTTSTLYEIPATPASSQTLNLLIPMSPLTPLPETPLPPRLMSNTDHRYSSNMRRGLPLIAETTEHSRGLLFPRVAEPSIIKSRLPRPASSMAPPPAPSSRLSRPGTMGPPPVTSSTAGPSTRATTATTSKKTAVTAPRKDAFAMLMKKPREEKERLEKEKAKQRATRSMAPPDIFASISKPKESLSNGSLPSKVKVKDKMRPRMKSKQENAPRPALVSDEEEEMASEPELHVESETPVEPVLTPVIVPEDPPLTSTRMFLQPFLRPQSLPVDAGMEIVEDSEGEGRAEGQVLIDTASTEHVSNEDIEFHSTLVVEVPAESSPDVDAASEHIDPIEDSIASDLVPRDPEQHNDVGQMDVLPPSRTRESKLPLGKRRQPTTVASVSRVTRSISNSKKKNNEAAASTSTAPLESSKITDAVTAKRTVSGVVKKLAEANGSSKASSTDVVQEKAVLPPGSPMKLSSPGKSLKATTPKKTPNRFTFSTKPVSTPSPTKIARSSSLSSMKPSSFTAARTFSMAPSQVAMGAGSSLSTLSNALEKLRMPAPSRPNTSMGFNRDAPGNSDDEEPAARTKDDVGVGRASFGLGRPQGLKRANTLGTDAFGVPAVNTTASSSRTGSSTGKNFVQKPLSMFMSDKGAASKAGASRILRGTGRTSIVGNKPIFGVGGGPRRTISKKTTLPVVIGSPVKGGTTSQMMEEDEEEYADEVRTQVGEENPITSEPRNESILLLEDLSTTEGSEKGKGKEKDFRNVSRRVSMVSHALSQSLSAIPPPPPRGLMGPPATPPHAGRSPKRSTSSSYPSSSAGGSSPSQPGTSTGTRASARIAKVAPLVATFKGGDGAGKKAASEAAPAPNPAIVALKVLKDCVIFVDVKTDTGDEAGSLFVEMLEGVGARVLTRVGQTCTHIVYKNGLMSTLSRYRLLRDPKPLVVGIAWVVECVEQRKRVDEADFLVDIESGNIAGINKRRRSMLPKSFAHEIETPSSEADKDEDADRSMDGSTSSAIADDDLAPLERARRRKSIMIGLRS